MTRLPVVFTGSHSKRNLARQFFLFQHRHASRSDFGLGHRKPVWNVCEPSLCCGFEASCFLARQLRILVHKCGVAVSPKEHHQQQDQVSSCCCLPTPAGDRQCCGHGPACSRSFLYPIRSRLLQIHSLIDYTCCESNMSLPLSGDRCPQLCCPGCDHFNSYRTSRVPVPSLCFSGTAPPTNIFAYVEHRSKLPLTTTHMLRLKTVRAPTTFSDREVFG